MRPGRAKVRAQLREILGSGAKTERFVDAAISHINAFKAGAYNKPGTPYASKRIATLIETIKACEKAMLAEFREPGINLEFHFDRGCTDLGVSRQLPYFLDVAKELNITWRALENELPSLSDVKRPHVKTAPRDKFVVALITDYESIFDKPAGHSESATFNRALKVILRAAGMYIENPKKWIRDARSRVPTRP
jgi:hypothetical protein